VLLLLAGVSFFCLVTVGLVLAAGFFLSDDVRPTFVGGVDGFSRLGLTVGLGLDG
jgi:hypothetical protein